MKKSYYAFLIVFGALLISKPITANAKTPVKKALFVIVDGVARDMLKGASTPCLDSISANGAFAYAHVGGGRRCISAITYHFSTRL